jgi:hypothetical protein
MYSLGRSYVGHLSPTFLGFIQGTSIDFHGIDFHGIGSPLAAFYTLLYTLKCSSNVSLRMKLAHETLISWSDKWIVNIYYPLCIEVFFQDVGIYGISVKPNRQFQNLIIFSQYTCSPDSSNWGKL